ncbi:MAG: RNA-binding cell elongation regulator Jag/EloR [Clostridia bacterium]
MKEKNRFEFKESTVDEAIAVGLKELGLAREEAEIEIKSYGGLFSKACVIISPKEKEEQPISEDAAESEESFAPTAPYESDIQADKGYGDEEIIRAEQMILDFVSDLTYRMGIKSEVTSKRSGNEIYISVDGDDAGMIIGYRGEVLDAIQYYALVLANKGEKTFIRVQVDAGNYRKRRQETLANLANRLARKAARTGRRTELEPMNPYERRIIHTTLLNDKFVTTESEGEGRYRHVVIIPKNKDGRGGYSGGGYSGGGGYGGRGGDRRGYGERNDRREYSERNDRRDYSEKPQPENDTEDTSEENGRLSSSDFRKKGFGKTRSFGYNNKRF